MESTIRFTPKSGGLTYDLDLADLNMYPSGFEGIPTPRGAVTFSHGSEQVSVIHSTELVYAVEFTPALLPTSTLPGTMGRFTAWVAHAKRGGEFEFIFDNNYEADQTTNSDRFQGSSEFAIDLASDFTVGEWVMLEHPSDPTRWEYAQIKTTGTSPYEFITIEGDASFDYPTGSIVRAFQYVPKAVLDPLDQPVFTERPAGQGSRLWDLRFTIRAVRA